MSYCVQADIEKLLPAADLIQLADDDEDGTADAAVIAEAIATADGDIDGYLQERYTLPLSSTPEIVKNISVDLSIYNLYSRRDIDNPVRTARNTAALKKLTDIAKGVISLGLTTPESETGGSIQSTTEDTDRIFDSDTMENF